MWEVRKQKLYGDDSCPNQLQSQSSPGVPLGLRGKGMVSSQMVSSGKVCYIVFVMHVEHLLLRVMCVCMYLCTCTCGCKCKWDNVLRP